MPFGIFLRTQLICLNSIFCDCVQYIVESQEQFQVPCRFENDLAEVPVEREGVIKCDQP